MRYEIDLPQDTVQTFELSNDGWIVEQEWTTLRDWIKGGAVSSVDLMKELRSAIAYMGG